MVSGPLAEETAREREGDAQTQVGVTQSQADDAQGEEGEPAKQTRERSKISFPYNDLDDGVVVARAIYEHFGTECTIDQLAGAMKSTANSGTFRIRVSTARIFGFVTTSRGEVALTDLGQAIVDRAREKDARAHAFLNVPLYRAIYEKYRGNVLPPAAALESEMKSLGVATKQGDKARLAFDRSAQQAGFYEHGKNRLIKPGGAGAPADQAQQPGASDDAEALPDDTRNGGGGPPTTPLHPFIAGLLQTLPEPETDWPARERAKWLETAANIFDLIYEGEGGIEVRLAVAERSPRPDNLR